MDNMHDNELQHHGVKGMKWGVRKIRKEAIRLSRMASRSNDPNIAKQLNDRAKSRSDEADRIEQEQAAREHRAQQVKRGAIAVAAALAVVGGIYMKSKATKAKAEKKAAKADKKLLNSLNKMNAKIDKNAYRRQAASFRNDRRTLKNLNKYSSKINAQEAKYRADKGKSLVNAMLAYSGRTMGSRL